MVFVLALASFSGTVTHTSSPPPANTTGRAWHRLAAKDGLNSFFVLRIESSHYPIS